MSVVLLDHILKIDTNNAMQTGDKPFRWRFNKGSISFFYGIISVEKWNMRYLTSQNDSLSLFLFLFHINISQIPLSSVLHWA